MLRQRSNKRSVASKKTTQHGVTPHKTRTQSSGLNHIQSTTAHRISSSPHLQHGTYSRAMTTSGPPSKRTFSSNSMAVKRNLSSDRSTPDSQSLRQFSSIPEKRRVICKPTSKLSVGIVGMPNIGKSMIFNCLTDQNVPSQNYPFCTIDPTSATVAVPDKRLQTLSKVHNSQTILNSTLTITDIAGLVRGASEGKGLGNEFLSNILSTDAIFHLVRIFPDPKGKQIEHVEGSLNPVRDMEIISTELLLKDQKQLETAITRLSKQAARSSDPIILSNFSTAKKALELCKQGIDVREGVWNDDECRSLLSLGLITSKPIIYLLNASSEEYLTQYSPLIEPVRQWIAKRSPGSPSILFSGDWEADLMLMEPDERDEYVRDAVAEMPPHPKAHKLIEYGEGYNELYGDAYLQQQALELVDKSKSMLPLIITSGFSALNLIQYFTIGPMETRSWSIQKGFNTAQSAGVIHTDFEKNFVAAEVFSYEDIAETPDEEVLKKQGKMKTQGKGYIVNDGDVMLFKHTAKK